MIHSHRWHFKPLCSNMHTEFLGFIAIVTQLFSSGRKCTYYRTEVISITINVKVSLKVLVDQGFFFMCLSLSNYHSGVKTARVLSVKHYFESSSFTHPLVSSLPISSNWWMWESNPVFHTSDS